ncbi:hypothetical protein ACJX0J_001774 [Zea mays]
MYRERHTLIIYDDLSKQAQAYRQIVGSANYKAFAQFASALDKTSQNQLARGRRLTGIVATIYTGTRGYLDSLEIEQVKKFLDDKTFTEQAETLLKEAIQEQLERFSLQEQT